MGVKEKGAMAGTADSLLNLSLFVLTLLLLLPLVMMITMVSFLVVFRRVLIAVFRNRKRNNVFLPVPATLAPRDAMCSRVVSQDFSQPTLIPVT